MSKQKKSFIAYNDWRNAFDKMPDEAAGKLIKALFAFANGEDISDLEWSIAAPLEQYKSIILRDSEKWSNQVEQRSLAGKKSAEVRSTKSNDRSTTVNDRQRKSTDSVSVSVSDSVNVDKQVIFNKWLSYRKEIKKPIIVDSTLNTLINKFNSEPIEKVEYVVNSSIENGWQGLFWDKYVMKSDSFTDNNGVITKRGIV